MLEPLLGLLVELIGEVLFQIVGEIVAEAGITSVRHATRQGSAINPIVAGFGLTLLGAMWGGFTYLVIPHRVLPVPPVPGLSIALSPLASGMTMHAYGRWLIRRGSERSPLATFWGGALFALAFAVTRFLLIAR